MAIASPGEQVAGPNCVPSRYGLLSVAEVQDMPDGHWQAGFTWDRESCEDLEVRTIACQFDTPKTTDGSGLSFPESDGFVTIAPFDCSVAGLTLSDAWMHAEARLNQGEARTIERAFWTGMDAEGNPIRGTLGVDPAIVAAPQLAPDPVTDLTPAAGAVSITDGLAMLESWAGDSMPCAPIIHAQRGVATYLAERRLIEPNGNVMYAIGTGSRVVVGGGYGVTGPAGVVPTTGEAWLFATGAVKVLRGRTFFTPDRDDYAAAVDRRVNDITVFAERPYGFALGCGVAAVRVHMRSCCC